MLHLTTKLARPYHIGVLLLSMVVLFASCASQNAAKGNAAEDNKLITDIITSEDADSTVVTVKGNQTLTYTAIKQVFPLGVLFHFPATALDNIKTVYYPPENNFISSIRSTQVEEDGITSRIFIALKKDLPYSIEPDALGLNIVFPKSGKLAAPTPAKASQANEATVEPTAEPAPEPAKTPAAPATRITSVSATPLKQNVVIAVKADGTITDFKSFTISETPPRIVYDIFKLKSPYKGEQRIAVKSDQVRKVRHFGHPDKIRLVLETNKAYLSKYSAKPVDNGLLIYVGQAPAPVSEEKPAAIEAQAQAAKPDQPAATVPPAAEKSEPVKHDKPAWLNRIDFASEEAGKSAIIVGTTRPVEYQMVKVDPQRIQLKLLDTNLPEYRKRALITTRFQSAVDRITPTFKAKSKETVLDIELREGVPYFVKQTDDVIRVDFSASKIPPRPYEDAKLPAWKKAMVEPSTEPGTQEAAAVSAGQQAEMAPAAAEGLPSAGEASKSPLAKSELKLVKEQAKQEMSLAERLDSAAPAEEKYTGEKIALDFYDTDIKNVFRIIREISGKNFAIDKNVTGKVTLTLDKPVPWDQVLELVLKMNQLEMTMEGDIIRIATIASLAQEEKQKEALVKATQNAVKEQKKLEPLVTEFIPVYYSDAETEVKPHIQTILSERGKVSVDKRNNQLILTAIAENIKHAKEIVLEIDKVTPQVTIEARIVEANSSFSRDLGFDWGTIQIGAINPLQIGDASLDFTLLASNLPIGTPAGSAGFTFQKLTGTDFSIIDAKLEASQTEGKTNIVSAPKVTTLDSKEAIINQGLKVPYLERDSSGNSTTKYIDVLLELKVTPKITLDDRVRLLILITKMDVVAQSDLGPVVSTNEANTELLVDNGDTIVIGGIVKSNLTHDETGIPGLMNMGVLGWLFKSQAKENNKSELLIFLTPRIIKLEQKSTGA